MKDLSDFIHRLNNSLNELYVVKRGCREPSGYTLNKPEHSVMKNNKILKETLAGVIGPSFATQLRPATSLWPPPKLAEKMTDISPKGINCSKLNDVKYFR